MDANQKRGLFFVLFVALAFAAQHVRFSSLVGAPNQFFTLFHFFAPVAGYFLGPILGAASIVVAQLPTLWNTGSFDWISALRVLPAVAAAYYFGNFGRKKESFFEKLASPLVWGPLACMGVFLLDPVARGGWLFSLYWWIPIAAVLFFDSSSIARALGATFMGHAVGSALWAHSVPMTSAAWLELIPVVAYERTFFALGIFLTFEAAHFAFERLENRFRTQAIAVRAHRNALSV